MLEQFAIVKYIECYLRPQVMKVLATDKSNDAITTTDRFWGFEPYLIKHRPNGAIAGHFVIPAITLGVLVATFMVRLFLGWAWWDSAGLIINLITLFFLWLFSYQAWNMLREWSAYDKQLADDLEKDYGRESDHRKELKLEG